jgi:hypothetical protein
MTEQAKSTHVGVWIAAVALVALGLRAVFFSAVASGDQNFFGLLSLPVGVTLLIGLVIERWWPVVRRRRLHRRFR